MREGHGRALTTACLQVAKQHNRSVSPTRLRLKRGIAGVRFLVLVYCGLICSLHSSLKPLTLADRMQISSSVPNDAASPDSTEVWRIGWCNRRWSRPGENVIEHGAGHPFPPWQTATKIGQPELTCAPTQGVDRRTRGWASDYTPNKNSSACRSCERSHCSCHFRSSRL